MAIHIYHMIILALLYPYLLIDFSIRYVHALLKSIHFSSGDYTNALFHYDKGVSNLPQVSSIVPYELYAYMWCVMQEQAQIYL